jgi:hypothetical protein
MYLKTNRPIEGIFLLGMLAWKTDTQLESLIVGSIMTMMNLPKM